MSTSSRRRRGKCVGCGRATRRTVRFPDTGESYRVLACSMCPVLPYLRKMISPEIRLLAAVYGGVDRMPAVDVMVTEAVSKLREKNRARELAAAARALDRARRQHKRPADHVVVLDPATSGPVTPAELAAGREITEAMRP